MLELVRFRQKKKSNSSRPKSTLTLDSWLESHQALIAVFFVFVLLGYVPLVAILFIQRGPLSATGSTIYWKKCLEQWESQ